MWQMPMLFFPLHQYFLLICSWLKYYPPTHTHIIHFLQDYFGEFSLNIESIITAENGNHNHFILCWRTLLYSSCSQIYSAKVFRNRNPCIFSYTIPADKNGIIQLLVSYLYKNKSTYKLAMINGLLNFNFKIFWI